jgi:hypothetical protein
MSSGEAKSEAKIANLCQFQVEKNAHLFLMLFEFSNQVINTKIFSSFLGSEIETPSQGLANVWYFFFYEAW